MNDVLEFCKFTKIYNPEFYSASRIRLRKLSVLNYTLFASLVTSSYTKYLGNTMLITKSGVERLIQSFYQGLSEDI